MARGIAGKVQDGARYDWRGISIRRIGGTLKAVPAILATLTVATAIAATAARAADPNTLWDIVHLQCLPNELEHENPAPCAVVDLSAGINKGYVVLKDRNGATQFLLIPIRRIAGIESPDIRAPDAPNYFDLAWAARTHVERAAGQHLARDVISLAINSVKGRSQNQLHIHIDCVRADVRDALHAHAAEMGDAWAPFPAPLAGQRYVARNVAGETLGATNPFVVLADDVPGAKDAMGEETLVVVGMTFAGGRPGFVLLARRADATAHDAASGEELQDHTCAVAAKKP